jgi:hypothetical protein
MVCVMPAWTQATQGEAEGGMSADTKISDLDLQMGTGPYCPGRDHSRFEKGPLDCSYFVRNDVLLGEHSHEPHVNAKMTACRRIGPESGTPCS